MERSDTPIAHAVERDGAWQIHELEDHLRAVSSLAADFATRFDADRWAALAGLWHDLGKYRAPFQHYIRTARGLDAQNAHIGQCPGHTTHSTAGALLAQQRLGPVGHVLAYLIAGHHPGLHDWHGGLHERLMSEDARRELAVSLSANPPRDILQASAGGLDSTHRPANWLGVD